MILLREWSTLLMRLNSEFRGACFLGPLLPLKPNFGDLSGIFGW